MRLARNPSSTLFSILTICFGPTCIWPFAHLVLFTQCADKSRSSAGILIFFVMLLRTAAVTRYCREVRKHGGTSLPGLQLSRHGATCKRHPHVSLLIDYIYYAQAQNLVLHYFWNMLYLLLLVFVFCYSYDSTGKQQCNATHLHFRFGE